MDLEKMTCEPCRGDSRGIKSDEYSSYLNNLPGWQIVAVDGVDRLEKSFTFHSYPAALGFVQQVGEAADGEDHHPVMEISWGKVKVTWWTHAIDGLHRNDMIMAARTEALYRTLAGHGES